MAKIFNRAIKLGGESRKVGTPSITVLEYDADSKVTRAKGATVPTDGDAGYAVGCEFVQTDGSAGTIKYINEGSNSSADFNKQISVLSGSVTFDPASLVDGAGETKSLTVTGAALGDFVLVSAPYDLVDILVTGYVQATNTVEIRVQNESGSTADLASGTWKVLIIKQ